MRELLITDLCHWVPWGTFSETLTSFTVTIYILERDFPEWRYTSALCVLCRIINLITLCISFFHFRFTISFVQIHVCVIYKLWQNLNMTQVLGDRILHLSPSPLFSWKTIPPFFSFFLVFLWLTWAISSEKSHYFISSEKSHYFLQFTIQPLPRSILSIFNWSWQELDSKLEEIENNISG